MSQILQPLTFYPYFHLLKHKFIQYYIIKTVQIIFIIYHQFLFRNYNYKINCKEMIGLIVKI